MSIPNEALRIAAKWWADCLRKTMKQDNGDPSAAGGMAMAMQLLLADRGRPDAAGADRFEAALLKVMESHAAHGWISIGVDYHPDGYLQDVVSAAGLAESSLSCFPIKTHMSVAPETVSVSVGYRAEPQILWSMQSTVAA